MFDIPCQAEDEQSRLRFELERTRALQPKVTRVSQLQRDLKELDQKISGESSKLGGGDTTRSQLTVRRELQEAQMKVLVGTHTPRMYNAISFLS